MAFKVQIPDGSWHSTEDLTGFELRAIEKATDTPWSVLNPFREIDAYRAIVAAFAIRHGMTDVELTEWFDTRTARDLAAGLKLDDADADLPELYEDGIPKAEGGPSTPSSATSPAPLSDGPPT